MPNYDEQKVSITLSYEAYQIIKDDMNIFIPEVNWAGFINSILSGFMDSSNASIKSASLRERQRIIDLLKSNNEPLTPTEKTIIDTLENDFRNRLRSEMKSYSTDSYITKKIRISNDNAKAINMSGDSDYFDKEDYSSAGKYIKALLEDYARQQFSIRERIIFHHTFNVINNCISSNSLLKLVYKSRDDVKSILKIKPYGILTDKLNGYHYCVGLLYDTQVDMPPLFSLRISRICSVRQLSQTSRIKPKEKAYIESQIKNSGVAYIQGTTNECEIELTPKGEKLYRSILHLRPRYKELPQPGSNGNMIYIFDCTDEQIRNYFFQFGKEAKITKPKYLKEEFFARFSDAASIYMD